VGRLIADHTSVAGDVNSAPYRATGASLAVLIFALVCFAGVMLLHALRGEINPLRQVMSEYANGSHGLVMTIVFYGFGLASLALAFRLRRAIDLPGITRLFPLLLALAGSGLIVSGVFEVERALVPDTIEEVIHSNASVVAFMLLIASMFLFSLACRSDARWWNFRWISASLSAAGAVVATATPLSAGTGWSGAIQRLLGLTVLLWLVLTALHVRRRGFEQTS
jgi:hypothetical protein